MPPVNKSTSIFDMVLNVVGGISATATLNKVQDSINKVVLSTNRATQAAKMGRVSADIQRVAAEKMAASYNMASTRLDLFRAKIQTNAQEIGRLTNEATRLNQRISEQQAALSNANAAHAKTIASGRANAGILKAQSNAIGVLTLNLRKNLAAQAENNAALTKASDKEKLYQAQLRAREARLAAQKVKMEEIQKPLSRFESVLATAIQLYRAFERVNRTYEKLTLNIQRTVRIAEKVRSFFGKTPSGAGMASGQVPSEALASQDALSTKIMRNVHGLGLLGTAAAYALGQIIVGIGARALNSVINLGRGALTTVAAFERLNISLRAMLAVQSLNTGASMDMQEAIKLQTGNAAKLVRELERIGIVSPFSTEAVKNAFQQGMGMGFAADQALRLTKASLDWAAATGKSGYAVEHVVFVMAQMRSAGKLVYQDLYQLAQLGIGMDQINIALAKSLGKTVEEIYRLRDAGQITAQQGIEAITQYMEQFQGAAKDQAQTLEGLINSLGDIGPIFLRNFFGPLDLATGKVQGVLGSIRVQLAEFVDFLQQDWVIEISRRIGVGLGEISDRALGWGRNIVMNLAEGIYQGALALINALTYIGNLLAYWLAPGSPPRIAPDIGRWGAEAMAEFFKGFGLADIGGFREVSGAIEQMLRSLVVNAEGDKVGILERIFGSRTALAQLMETLRTVGSVSEDIFQSVFAAIGGPSPAVQNYLRAFVAVEQQSRIVKAAQEELNRVTKHYQELLKPIDDELYNVNNAQQDLVEANRLRILQLVLQDPNATAAEKEMARLEIEKLNAEKRRRMTEAEAKQAIEAAQTKVDAEGERLTQMQDELALQQELVNQQNEQNRLLQEYLDLVERLAQAGGAGGGGQNKPDRTLGPPGGFPDLPEPGGVTMPQFITDLIAKLGELQTAWGNAMAAISNTMAPVKTAMDGFWLSVQNLGTSFTNTKDTILTFVTDGLRFLIQTVSNTLPTIVANISTAINQIAIFWTNNHETILAVLNGAWRIAVVTVSVFLLIISAIMAAAMQAINGDWSGAWETIKGTTKTALDVVLGLVGQDTATFNEIWRGNLELLKIIVATGLTWLRDSAFGAFLRDVINIILGWFRFVLNGFRNFLNFLGLIVKILLAPIYLAWVVFKDEIIEVARNLWTYVTTVFSNFLRIIRAVISVFAALFTGDWQKFADGLQTIWESLWGNIQAFADLIIGNILTAVGGLWNKVVELAGLLGNTLIGQFIGNPGYTPPDTNASGGTVKPGTVSWTGERGPELVFFGQTATIVDALTSKRLVGQGMVSPPGVATSRGGGGGSVVYNGPTYNYAPTYQGAPPSPQRDFAIMEVWSR